MRLLERVGLWFGGITLVILVVYFALYAFAFVMLKFFPMP